MLWGLLLVFLGGFGTGGMILYISNDTRYTYSSPFTDHELVMMALLIIFFILLVIGILVTIFSFIQKNNQDTLSRIESLQPDGRQTGICPICKLNISPGVKICPKCGHHITEEE